MQDKNHEGDIKMDVVNMATNILQNKIGLIEGCRRLVQLHYKLDGATEIFLPLIGIVSETDEFPLGEQRLGWSRDCLERMDKERDDYLLKVQEIISNTCLEIISELS
jgi:hypothetical protein